MDCRLQDNGYETLVPTMVTFWNWRFDLTSSALRVLLVSAELLLDSSITSHEKHAKTMQDRRYLVVDTSGNGCSRAEALRLYQISP